MGVGTLVRYLILGDRQAIRTIARSRHALAVGALFVLSAGLAREYDGEDLLHEPWHLLLPFAASVAASAVLYVASVGHPCRKGNGFRGYFSFLALFWMTAPLAWLYAVPYERFLSARQATAANLLTLAVVAAWRVALMARVLQVGMGYARQEAAVKALFVANGLLLLALGVKVLGVVHAADILSSMGGVRQPEEETVVGTVTFFLFPLSVFACIALGVLLGYYHPSRPRWRVLSDRAPAPSPSRPLWCLAVVSVAAWVIVLPFTQPEQQRRHRVERAFEQGRLDEALAEMSAHPREAFPSHWVPPPPPGQSGYSKLPGLLDVMDKMIEGPPPADWVREAYLARFRRILLQAESDRTHDWRIAAILRRLPEGQALLAELEQGSWGAVRAGQLRDCMKELDEKEQRR
jgi:hypothetical protein